MAESKYTIIGLENYLSHWNKSLFSGVTFPDGIDKENAINQIILDSGEFEVLYSDPDFMTEAITLWSNNRFYTFQKWLEGLSASFSPIENYDRYEDTSDEETTGNNRLTDMTDTNNLTKTHDMTDTYDTIDTNRDTRSTDVSAYDTSGYSPKDKVTDTGTLEKDGTVKTGGTIKDTGTTRTAGSVTDNGSRDLSHTSHIHGNIGVTTGQQLVEGFLELYGSNNIYEMIAADFVTRFCIMVY